MFKSKGKYKSLIIIVCALMNWNLLLADDNLNNSADDVDKRSEQILYLSGVIDFTKSLYTKNLNKDNDAVNDLADYEARYLEVVTELIKRVHYEIQYIPHERNELQSYFLQNAITAILELSTENFEARSLSKEDLINVVNPAHKQLSESLTSAFLQYYSNNKKKENTETKETITMFLHAIASINTRSETLPSVFEEITNLDISRDLNNAATRFKVDTPELKDFEHQGLEKEFDFNKFFNTRDFQEGKKNVQRIAQHLNEFIIGQPEVIDHLISLEKRKLLHLRKKPVSYIIMGLPGGGKDTSAEEYVQAMHPDDKEAVSKHLYRFSIAYTESELWYELGATGGFTSSDKGLSPFIKWAVAHSGGRYFVDFKIDKNGQPVPSTERVLENKLWKGRSLPNTTAPENSVVFLNEFHDWAYNVKNIFAKQFLEKGIVQINNHNGGLEKMTLPFTIALASNNGIELYADRTIDGRAKGKRQTFEEANARYLAVKDNKRALKASLMKRSGDLTSGGNKGGGKGTSEEVASRINKLILQRVLSQEDLIIISNNQLKNLAQQYLELNESVGKVELSWDINVAAFIADFLHDPEENARQVSQKITEHIESTIDGAIYSEHIEASKEGQKVHITIVPEEDGTYKLKVDSDKHETQLAPIHIETTEKAKYNKPLSKSEINKLSNLDKEINSRVAGMDHMSEQIRDAILAAQLNRNVNTNRLDGKLPGATKFGFFGLSSTGKTELAKVIAEVLTGSKDNIWEIEGNHLQKEHQWEELFGLESDDPDFKSKFLQKYDRYNGNFVVLLDELSNVRDKNLTTKLYPYLRLSEISGKSLANVIFIVTGNTGEEIYRAIPENVPDRERFYAEQKIFKLFNNNEQIKRDSLLQDFTDALLKRIGMKNIVFFAPHNHITAKVLFQIKIIQALKSDFSIDKERHWWGIEFADKDNFNKLLDKMGDEGFQRSEQGESVHKYVFDEFTAKLKIKLASENVEIGEKVIISYDEEKTTEYSTSKTDEVGAHKKGIYLKAKVESTGQKIDFFMPGKPYIKPIPKPLSEEVQTSFHESGHGTNTLVLMHEYSKPKLITRIPGVDFVAGKLTYYAGIWEATATADISLSRELMVRRMAMLLGGYVAETLVTKHERHSEGISNDIARVSKLARHAILELGFSEEFGMFSKPQDITVDAYEDIIRKDPAKSALFDSEINKLIREATRLSQEGLLINWDLFIDLGKEVAEKAQLDAEDIQKVVDRNNDTYLKEGSAEFTEKQILIRLGHYYRDETGRPIFLDTFKKRTTHWAKNKLNASKDLFKNKNTKRIREDVEKHSKTELIHESLMPKNFVTVAEFIEKKVQKDRASVAIRKEIPFTKNGNMSTEDINREEVHLSSFKASYINALNAKTLKCASLFK